MLYALVFSACGNRFLGADYEDFPEPGFHNKGRLNLHITTNNMKIVIIIFSMMKSTIDSILLKF